MIDSFDRAWFSSLDAFAPAGARMHLLLDGAFVPGLHRKIATCLPSGATVSLLFEAFPGCNEEVRDASPFVLPYTARNADLQGVLAQCDGLPMVHAIASDEETNTLAARLAHWCAVEADHQRFNLRFPDTRRLPGIFAALDRKQRSALIGPINQWRFIARNGAWAALDLSSIERGIEPDRDLFAAGCLLLAPAQFAAMVDDGEADSVLLRLRDRGHSWPLLRSAAHARVEAALTTARQTALEETLMLDWCEACLVDEALLDAARQPGAIQRWRERAIAPELEAT